MVSDSDTLEGLLPVPEDVLVRRSSGEQAALYIRRLDFRRCAAAGRSGAARRDRRKAWAQPGARPGGAALAWSARAGSPSSPIAGAFIGALDESVVRDHYELYGHVYSFAAARAAERRTPEMLERLTDLQKQIQAAQDPQSAWRLNQAFHGTIVDMARSPRLHAVLRALAGIVPGNFFELVPGSVEVEKQGTAAILRRLKRGDAERASSEYVKMMRKQGDLVVALFASRGMLPETDKKR